MSTVVAVWSNMEMAGNPMIWAAADTRYSTRGHQESSSNILTDYGPKLFEVDLMVTAASASGFYDKVIHHQKIGLGFAGAALAALCVYSSTARILSSLSTLDGNIPSLENVHDSINQIARSYTNPIANPNRIAFCTIGYCFRSNANQVFHSEIGRDAVVHSRKVDFEKEGTLLLGSHQKEITEAIRLKEKEIQSWAGPKNPHRAPLRVVRDLVSQGTYTDIGGDVDVGILNQTQFRIHANLRPIEPTETGRNATLTHAGHDLFEKGRIGPCFVNIPGMA